MKIEWFENVGHSPAWTYYPQAQMELFQYGYAEAPHVPPEWNDTALVATHANGEVLGWIIYRVDSRRNTWYIMNSYTMPGDRRTGVFSALFTALVERARLRKITSIDSGTHINNVAAQAAFASQGRHKVGIIYAYPVCEQSGKSHLDIKE